MQQQHWLVIVFCALFVTACTALGLWTLRRLRERRRAQFGADVAPLPADEAPSLGTPPAARTVGASGAEAAPQSAEAATAGSTATPVESPSDAASRIATAAKSSATAVPAPAPISASATAAADLSLAPGLTDPAAEPPEATFNAVAPLLPEAPVEAPVVDLVLRAGLQKTQQGFIERINQLFRGAPKVDAAVLDALEEVLLSADVGVGLTLRLMDDLRSRLRSLTSAQQVHEALRAQLCKTLQEGTAKDVHGTAKPAQGTAPAGQGTDAAPAGSPVRPQVILFVGVNGVGKTTSIGKIATQMQAQGRRVMLAAADTFRAAAAEQLEIWAQRSGAQMMRGRANADPASVVFDAVKQATAGDIDVVLADTAGRLHTKVELMDEIKKVKRAAGKARPGAPDETWLVVDATTGQNALQQAQEFHQALGLTGIILTKLDGTAKGGVVVAVVDALKIPVRYIGVGEQAADLRPFDAAAFVAALFDTAADRAA